MTHICIMNWVIIDSGYGLSPGLCQAMTWNNAALSIGPYETNFGDIWIKIQNFSAFEIVLWKIMSSCPGLNVLIWTK